MATDLQEVRVLLAEARETLLARANVVAVGVGHKRVHGTEQDELALVCSVQNKRAQALLTAKELIPAQIQGVPTDVNPTGVIAALQNPKGRFRPTLGGVSIGHHLITAGTLGCLVKKGGKLCILSNNHVLANSNSAEIGDAILQPGPADGGSNPDDLIAHLSEFVPIRFEGEERTCSVGRAAAAVLNALAMMTGSRCRLRLVRRTAAENLVDCALAEPASQGEVDNSILQIGAISAVAEGMLGMSVKKSGRTTGFTQDVITQIDVTVRVSYGADKVATFVDQLMSGPMSQGGDSGSAVLNQDNEIVGLLFAGSESNTIINRIQAVFSALSVELP